MQSTVFGPTEDMQKYALILACRHPPGPGQIRPSARPAYARLPVYAPPFGQLFKTLPFGWIDASIPHRPNVKQNVTIPTPRIEQDLHKAIEAFGAFVRVVAPLTCRCVARFPVMIPVEVANRMFGGVEIGTGSSAVVHHCIWLEMTDGGHDFPGGIPPIPRAQAIEPHFMDRPVVGQQLPHLLFIELNVAIMMMIGITIRVMPVARGIVDSEINSVAATCIREHSCNVFFVGGTCHVVIGDRGIKHGKPGMVLGRENHIPHPGPLGHLHHLIGIELGGIECFVLRVVDLGFQCRNLVGFSARAMARTVAPMPELLAQLTDRPPMDKHAEALVFPRFMRLLRSTRQFHRRVHLELEDLEIIARSPKRSSHRT